MSLDLIIKVPFISKTAYTESEKTINTPLIKAIKTNYGTIISTVSKAVGIPENIITAFIWVESNGINTVPTTGIEKATGLMQISPAAIYDTLNHELKTNGLSETEKNIIKKYLPSANLSGKSLGVTYAGMLNSLVTAAKEPEFNILIGALYLGWLIDEEDYYEAYNTQGSGGRLNTKYNRMVRLDRVVARYNVGYYAFKAYGTLYEKTIYALNTIQLYTLLSGWSSGANITKYIRLVGGINGVMDILSK